MEHAQAFEPATTAGSISRKSMLPSCSDAADYNMALPKKESALPEWQAAIEALLLVDETGEPTMLLALAS
jgi:hypothetical protein